MRSRVKRARKPQTGDFVTCLASFHRQVFLFGPLGVRPGVSPGLLVPEYLEYDRRERRPRTPSSIGVDLTLRGDAL